MPWGDDVAAILLTWFPGQEGGHALADVLLGAHEPGGRLTTTWPAQPRGRAGHPVTPSDGELHYDEGVFIGYRAWERRRHRARLLLRPRPGYTDWEYESLDTTPDSVRVRLRNTGRLAGREIVQIYLVPTAPAGDEAPERPARWLAGFAVVEAAPGESAEAEIPLPVRAFEIWDETAGGRRRVKGDYTVEASHSIDDCRLTAQVSVR